MSGDAVGRTSIETLPSTSRSRRSLIWRLVTNLPSRPDSGEVLTPKVMLSVGSSSDETRQRARIGRVGDRVADGHVGNAGDGDDVARPGLGDVDPLDALGRGQAGDGAGQRDRAARLDRAVGRVGLLTDDRDALAHAQRAVPDPADGHAADVVVGRQVGDEQLERMVGRVRRWRGGRHQRVEERPQVGARHWPDPASPCPLGVGVEDREVELRGARAEVDEQLVDRVEHLGRARVATVDLVDRHDHRQVRARAPWRARSASGAVALRRRRPAAGSRRPSAACARPRRRSRRGRACRRCSGG